MSYFPAETWDDVECLGKLSQEHDVKIAIGEDSFGARFKQALYLVHDYVTETIGVISFFRVEATASSKVVAHGLGHSKGLRHHLEPIDLMHPELLRTSTLQVEGFCKACLSRLTKDQRAT